MWRRTFAALAFAFVSSVLAFATAQDAPPDSEAASPTKEATVAAPEVWKVPVGLAPVRGPKDALVTLVVFSDFQCPYCKRLAKTLDALQARYPNELRVAFKHRPLPFHPWAAPAAQLSLEAYAQGKAPLFWKVHDALFDASELDQDVLLDIARTTAMNVKRAERALAAEAHIETIEDDEALADSLGARGTPTSYVNGVKLLGAQPIDAFVTAVDEALARARALVATGVPRAKVYERLIANAREADDAAAEDEPTRRQAPAITKATPTRGPANAPVTVHIFTDFECPFCQRAKVTLDKLEARFKGKVRLAYHSMPLPMHPHARDAARFALEAYRQQGAKGFWAAHDRLFDSQRELDRESLHEHANALRLDVRALDKALDDGRHDQAIDADVALAESLDIRGTPAFLVEGYEVRGAQPLAVFSRLVKRVLAERAAAKKR